MTMQQAHRSSLSHFCLWNSVAAVFVCCQRVVALLVCWPFRSRCPFLACCFPRRRLLVLLRRPAMGLGVCVSVCGVVLIH